VHVWLFYVEFGECFALFTLSQWCLDHVE
jgi:hypothetical protein